MLKTLNINEENTDKENQVLKDYTSLAHEITSKFKSDPKSEDYKDAFQHAQLGILDAHRKYDESKGVKFITFAWVKAYNAVRKHLRGETGLMHIPHNSNEPIPAYVELPLEHSSNAHEELDLITIKLVLKEALNTLTDDEKLVLLATYSEREKASDIAEQLGWEVNKVYKTTQKALKKLRSNFDGKDITIEDFL